MMWLFLFHLDDDTLHFGGLVKGVRPVKTAETGRRKRKKGALSEEVR